MDIISTFSYFCLVQNIVAKSTTCQQLSKAHSEYEGKPQQLVPREDIT